MRNEVERCWCFHFHTRGADSIYGLVQQFQMESISLHRSSLCIIVVLCLRKINKNRDRLWSKDRVKCYISICGSRSQRVVSQRGPGAWQLRLSYGQWCLYILNHMLWATRWDHFHQIDHRHPQVRDDLVSWGVWILNVRLISLRYWIINHMINADNGSFWFPTWCNQTHWSQVLDGFREPRVRHNNFGLSWNDISDSVN